jgi:hypothetical protein
MPEAPVQAQAAAVSVNAKGKKASKSPGRDRATVPIRNPPPSQGLCHQAPGFLTCHHPANLAHYIVSLPFGDSLICEEQAVPTSQETRFSAPSGTQVLPRQISSKQSGVKVRVGTEA